MSEEMFGAIDLGSNSLQMMLARMEAGAFHICRREICETRIGEGLRPGDKLNPRARARTMEALLSLLGIMEAEQVRKGIIIATSALREAADGKQFLDEISRVAPFPIRLLSGEEEAFYGFQGAVGSLAVYGGDDSGPVLPGSGDNIDDDIMALDIGGRSTELSWREEDKINGLSMAFGAVNMKERFLSGREHFLREHIRGVLVEQAKGFPIKKKKFLLGVGGTITTLAALSLKLQEYDPQRIQGSLLSIDEIRDWEKILLQASHQERVQMLPFAPKRADVITAGVSVMRTVIEYLGYDQIIVSEGGILLGIILELFSQK